MKKILISLLTVFLGIIFLLNASYSEENNCKYEDKIEQCTNEKNKRSIEEFVCIEGSKEEIAFQIILDEKFSEIDEEIDEYLTNMEVDKDRFFGPNSESNYIEASNEIENKFSIYGEYWHRYNDFCQVELIEEVMECQDGVVSTINSSKYFLNSTCMNLAVTKLQIYRRVAYNILELNKKSVREDSSKEHMQVERTKYNEVFQLIRTNVGYLDSISKKWPSKLKNPY